MHLYLRGQDFHFELENVCRLFLPLEKIVTYHDEEPSEIEGLIVQCDMAPLGDRYLLSCRVRLDGFDETSTVEVSQDDDCELELCTLLYHLLVKLLGFIKCALTVLI